MARRKKIVTASIVAVIVVAISICSYLVGKNTGMSNNRSSSLSNNESEKYNLLAKRLFVDSPNDPMINFEPLRKQIKEYYSSNNLKGSIYFEYLPTGTSVRVDGDTQQVGASLIKLPAAMELYKAVEMNKVSLDDRITLTEEMIDSAYGELYKKGVGYTLTLGEAATIMLEKSDNTALKAVALAINGKVPTAMNPFSFADIDITQNNNQTVSISARSYGSLLKCLYFSCYNTKEYSQEILQKLTNSSFDNRLVAGVGRQDIKIAHKIGTFAQDTQSDCGIIYYPSRNYALCVMIKGTDSSETDKQIADISKLAYDYIASLQNQN